VGDPFNEWEDKKLVPHPARPTYCTCTMEKSRNAFAISKYIGHTESTESYQHQELKPLRVAIHRRSLRRVWSGFENAQKRANDPMTVSAEKLGEKWWTR